MPHAMQCLFAGDGSHARLLMRRLRRHDTLMFIYFTPWRQMFMRERLR